MDFQLTMDATIPNIETATNRIAEELEEVDCPVKPMVHIMLALDEILNNIASYAYAPNTGSVTVKLSQDEATGDITLTFIDQGVPFNPLLRPDPDTTSSIDDRSIGGLGIFLVKRVMDNMTYSHENGSNVLTLTKCISAKNLQ